MIIFILKRLIIVYLVIFYIKQSIDKKKFNQIKIFYLFKLRNIEN